MSAGRHLLVDGYNVIRSTVPYREIAENDMESARAALVADVAGFAGREWRATIVFDGAGNPHSTGGTHSVAGIDVIFSAFGVEADTVIERMASELRSQGAEVQVVTSDAQTQWAVLGESVSRRSATEFAGELGDARSGWEAHSATGGKSSRIEDRIDSDVRRVLERWARGKR